MSRSATHLPTTACTRARRGRRSLLAIAIGFVIAVLAVAPAAFADTATPINGSIHLSYQFVDPNNPAGAVTVYAQGQWNWSTHHSDCNTDRAGAGVALIWSDPNEPGYAITGKDVNGRNISYGVGVSKKLNGDPYNLIDGTVHPVDLGVEGGANASQAGLPAQVFQDVAPVASGKPQDTKDWRGGCGREPLNGPQFPGIPYGSWGYDPEVNGGLGYAHTYMSLADVTTVCVNMYDVHGGDKVGGKNFQIAAGSNEIDAGKSGDNTIKAGQFDPSGLNCVTPQPDLAISKTDGVTSVVPGTSTTYTITVSNKGQEPAVNQTVTDNLPAGVTSDSWTAVASAGSSADSSSGNGNINTTVTVAAGGTVTFTVVANVSPSATGTLANIASVTVPPGDATTANNTATDTDSLTPRGALAITKTDGVTTVTSGGTTTYTVVVTNNGPSRVSATVEDPISGGLSFTPVSESITLDPGGSATYTIPATVTASSGTVTNTATVAIAGGATDPAGPSHSISDTDTVIASGPDVSITKDDAVPALRLASTSITTYTVVVTNNGPATATGTVSDPIPVNGGGMSWTSTGTAGTTNDAPIGSGPLTADVIIPAGGSVIFFVTVTGITDANGPDLVNTATVAVADDPNTANNTASDDDFLIGF